MWPLGLIKKSFLFSLSNRKKSFRVQAQVRRTKRKQELSWKLIKPIRLKTYSPHSKPRFSQSIVKNNSQEKATQVLGNFCKVEKIVLSSTSTWCWLIQKAFWSSQTLQNESPIQYSRRANRKSAHSAAGSVIRSQMTYFGNILSQWCCRGEVRVIKVISAIHPTTVETSSECSSDEIHVCRFQWHLKPDYLHMFKEKLTVCVCVSQQAWQQQL